MKPMLAGKRAECSKLASERSLPDSREGGEQGSAMGKGGA